MALQVAHIVLGQRARIVKLFARLAALARFALLFITGRIILFIFLTRAQRYSAVCLAVIATCVLVVTWQLLVEAVICARPLARRTSVLPFF